MTTGKRTTKFPPGWTEEHVRSLIAHYDAQTDEEAAAEIESAFENGKYTMFAVPNELVDKVRKLVVASATSKRGRRVRAQRAKRAAG